MKVLSRIIVGFSLLLLIWGQGCMPSSGQIHPPENLGLVSVDHSLFDALLKEYVSEKGEVDYAAIKQYDALAPYLEHLSQVVPDSLSEAEALAYWINAYNAFTLKLIVDKYPVKSIKEITPVRLKGLSLAIPKINSPFEFEIAKIAGKKYSLDDIEHKILRKQFDEPRIHFALVCAAFSCPPLRREAYVADQLDDQLDDQGHTFLHNPQKNEIDGANRHIRISKIFKWFKSDFEKDGKSLQQFLARYFEGAARQKLLANGFDVRYRKYNWKLNDVGVYAR